MIFERNDRIVFAGDSVTDMGSAKPVGESDGDELGFGYVRIIDNMLQAWYPERNIRVSNAGISGNTSRDLLERFERDVISLQPQWVSICIGINDVWRQFDTPAMPECQVSPKEYEANMAAMIHSSKAIAKGVIVCSPYYMEPCREDKMRKRMDIYTEICRELAQKYDCIFVDFQKMYDRYFFHQHSCFIAWDRVHPNQKGATLMAREILRKCGFDFNKESLV